MLCEKVWRMKSTAKTASAAREVVIVCCRRAVKGSALEQAEVLDGGGGLAVRPMIVPCSSKVEVPQILRILEAGADGVEIVACPDGNCQFLVGNVRARRRVDFARRLLEAAGVGAGRVGVSRVEGLSRARLMSLARARAEEAAEAGPNPMKEERNA